MWCTAVAGWIGDGAGFGVYVSPSRSWTGVNGHEGNTQMAMAVTSPLALAAACHPVAEEGELTVSEPVEFLTEPPPPVTKYPAGQGAVTNVPAATVCVTGTWTRLLAEIPPADPCAPCAPWGPMAPCGPVAPTAPVAP